MHLIIHDTKLALSVGDLSIYAGSAGFTQDDQDRPPHRAREFGAKHMTSKRFVGDISCKDTHEGIWFIGTFSRSIYLMSTTLNYAHTYSLGSPMCH